MHEEVNYMYVTKRKQKAPINMFYSKAPKTQQIAVTGTREKPVDFIFFSSRNNFVIKVSVPVHSSISWTTFSHICVVVSITWMFFF